MSNLTRSLLSFRGRAENRRIPSGPSHSPHRKDSFASFTSSWKGLSGYQSKPGISDEEAILDGKIKISLSRGDVLIVPKGRKGEVPEKYWGRVVEVPYIFDFSIVS